MRNPNHQLLMPRWISSLQMTLGAVLLNTLTPVTFPWTDLHILSKQLLNKEYKERIRPHPRLTTVFDLHFLVKWCWPDITRLPVRHRLGLFFPLATGPSRSGLSDRTLQSHQVTVSPLQHCPLSETIHYTKQGSSGVSVRVRWRRQHAILARCFEKCGALECRQPQQISCRGELGWLSLFGACLWCLLHI